MKSVIEINRGDVPWLRTRNITGNAPVQIMAGVTLESFVEQIERAGGQVFAPLGWGALRLEPCAKARWIAFVMDCQAETASQYRTVSSFTESRLTCADFRLHTIERCFSSGTNRIIVSSRRS
jgi:hypothetical protein